MNTVILVDRHSCIVAIDREWVQRFETVRVCWEAKPGKGKALFMTERSYRELDRHPLRMLHD